MAKSNNILTSRTIEKNIALPVKYPMVSEEAVEGHQWAGEQLKDEQ